MPPAPATRASIVRLMNATASAGCRGCGRSHTAAQSCASGHSHGHSHSRGMATPVDLPGPGNSNGDYAFEVSSLVDPPVVLAITCRACSTQVCGPSAPTHISPI